MRRGAAVHGNKITCTGKSWQFDGLKDFCYVNNITSGSYGRITANGADTITATLVGGMPQCLASGRLVSGNPARRTQVFANSGIRATPSRS